MTARRRWLATGLCFILFGAICVFHINGPQGPRNSLTVDVFRDVETVGTTSDDVFLNLDDHGGSITFRIHRRKARLIVVAVSNLKNVQGDSTKAPEYCSIAGRNAAGEAVTLSTERIHYQIVSDYEKRVAPGKKAVWAIDRPPDRVAMLLPEDYPDAFELSCETAAEPNHATYTKREYFVTSWTLLAFPTALEAALNSSVCPEDRNPCLHRSAPLRAVVKSENDSFAPTSGDLRDQWISRSWADESSAGWRDVFLLLAGTLFGTAGACLIEFGRPWIERAHQNDSPSQTII